MQLRRLPLDLRRALCCALVAGALAVAPGLAHADSVLLISPKRGDAGLQDVFHRVEAELKIHGYETQTAGSEAEAKPAASAHAAGAVAAIAVVKRGGAVALQVWLIDRAGGVSGPRRIEAGGARDASSLLAVRAVDLLRATFGEPPGPAVVTAAPIAPTTSAPPAADGGRWSSESPTTTVATTPPPEASPPLNLAPTTAAPTPPPRTATAVASTPPSPAAASKPPPSAASPPEQEAFVPEPPNAPSPPRARLWLSAEGALIYPGASFGTGFGPALGVDMWLVPWLSVGAHGAAPLLGTQLSTSSGSATVTEELAWLELRARVLALGPLEVYPLLGAGIDWLQAKGRANEPLLSRRGHNWSWMAQLGVRVEVALLPRLHAGAALRLAAFAPSLEVAVARDSAPLALPTLSATLGLALGLF